MDFKVGDKVRVKEGSINNGLGMEVTAVRDNEVRCDWFEGQDSIHKSKWFSAGEVVMVQASNDGFKNEGEG